MPQRHGALLSLQTRNPCIWKVGQPHAVVGKALAAGPGTSRPAASAVRRLPQAILNGAAGGRCGRHAGRARLLSGGARQKNRTNRKDCHAAGCDVIDSFRKTYIILLSNRWRNLALGAVVTRRTATASLGAGSGLHSPTHKNITAAPHWRPCRCMSRSAGAASPAASRRATNVEISLARS